MDRTIKDSLTEPIIKKAAELYDTAFDSIKTIGGFENFVFEYVKNEEEFILRFVHSFHRTTEQVYAELEFIDYLDKNDACVSTVVHSKNDNLLEIIELDNESYFTVCVFTKAPGGLVRRAELTDDFYLYFGEQVGKLHRLTKTYKPIHKRIQWYEEDYLEKSRIHMPKSDEIILKKHEKLIKKIKNLPKNVDNYGLIHTDLHFGNMFISSGELTFFDWDDASYKHFMSDIAIVLFYHYAFNNISQEEKNKQSARILALFLKGYRKENSIDLDFFKYLNDFLMLRTQVLYIVIYAEGGETLETDWAKYYINEYRQRIIDDIPFLDENLIFEAIK